jgi:methyl coenzyme M reductase gamma subunit
MFSENPNIIADINKEWGLTVPQAITENDLAVVLGHRINELIKNDMTRLISILYRIDVDEKKIREMLRENKGTDAGLIIAYLVIDRQKQKIKTRNMFNTQVDDIDEEDKW